MMHGRGKSSPVIVAGKPANKAQPETVTAAESVERRAGAKGNADQPATNRTQGRERVAASGLALALASIRQAAMLDCQYPRWEPYAGKLQVRVCAGGARQLASLPRLVFVRIWLRPQSRKPPKSSRFRFIVREALEVSAAASTVEPGLDGAPIEHFGTDLSPEVIMTA